MSLIHHWPLVDGLKDIIGRVPLTGDSTETIGKIGPCRELNEQFLRVTNSSLRDLSVFSVSMWFKYSSAKAAWTDIFGLEIQNNVSPKAVSLRLEITSIDGTSAGVFNNGILTNSSGAGKYLTLTKEKWHHFVLTKDNELIQYFLDGVLIQQYRFLDVVDCSDGWCTGEFHLGDEKYNYKGCFNDVRIYNHVLSQAEISELSKALSVHYTFNDALAEPTINLLPKNQRTQSNTSATIKVTEGIVNEATYTLSTYITRQPTCEATNPRLTLRFFYSDGTDESYLKYNDQGVSYPKDGVERYYYVTATAKKDKTLSSVGGRLLDHKSGTGKQMTATRSQLEIKDHPTPYTSQQRSTWLHNEAEGTQPDTNETKNVSIIIDSATGSHSLRCNETAIVTSLVADIDQGVTISCWVKVLEYPTSPNHNPNQVVFADTNSKLAFGFYNNTEAIVSCANYSAAKIINFQQAWMGENNILEKEWHHIVVTRNKEGIIRCWLNGLELTEKGTSNHWSQNKEALVIGTRYNNGYGPYFSGYIDDFRVYQTLLSESDILDLYKTKGYISNCGDMMCNEFVQEENEFLLNENSEAIAKNFVEHIPDGYEFIEYIANDNNKQYIDTGHYWHNEKATILADLEVTSNSSNQSLFGNEEVVGENNSRYFAHIFHGKNGSFSNYIGKGSAGATSIPLNTRMKVEYAAHGDNTFSIKTTKVATGEITTYNGTYSGSILTRQNTITNNGVTNLGHIFIFANHNSASGSGAIQQVGGMKLYGFIMIDNNECVRDFRPCRRTKDSVVGLFDMIEGKFYTTPVSAFVAGEAVSTDTSFQVLSDSTVYANQLIEI